MCWHGWSLTVACILSTVITIRRRFLMFAPIGVKTIKLTYLQSFQKVVTFVSRCTIHSALYKNISCSIQLSSKIFIEKVKAKFRDRIQYITASQHFQSVLATKDFSHKSSCKWHVFHNAIKHLPQMRSVIVSPKEQCSDRIPFHETSQIFHFK